MTQDSNDVQDVPTQTHTILEEHVPPGELRSSCFRLAECVFTGGENVKHLRSLDSIPANATNFFESILGGVQGDI